MSGEIHKESDGRSLDEIAADLVDPHLTDLFFESGLLEAGEGDVYASEDVIAIARAAWSGGAHFALTNRVEIKRIFLEYNDVHKRLNGQEESRTPEASD